MKALLLVAHGSRRGLSNDEVRELAAKLATLATQYAMVKAAFLELAEPSIPDGIQDCIDAGAQAVTVMPYFLSAGRHVVEDIPREVALKQNEHPNLSIRIAPYLGMADGIADVILGQAD